MPALNDLKTLFRQNDFSGGMNAQLDPTKTPGNAYPLLINGRCRENIISPTNKHVKLSAVDGNYQGLYVVGTFILLFIDGIAYYADINITPIIFRVVPNWLPMSATVDRIYADLAPATANTFNVTGTVQNAVKVFNGSLAIFSEALYCSDGTNDHPVQAITPDPDTQQLGSFATWTKDNPLYVPNGAFPTFAGAKLYMASTDLKRVLSSVSGRPSDFMINLDVNGNPGGDADTVSQTVSFNDITALRGLSTGEVLVGTLYGTFVLEPDFTNTQFGEPYLKPVPLFPAGPVNGISVVDILQDTAFITQSGIHAFNAVMQAKRASNNFPFGAKIRKLITNPDTRKAIVQSNTCCGLYDDYAFFALNTIYGYGAIVFDTTTQSFNSLDLSFGHVKQFATSKINGNERFFFITHENEVYEAFAGSEKNPTRILIGEFTPQEAPAMSVVYMVDSMFTNVTGDGQIKLSFFADRVLRASTVLEVDNGIIRNNLPIPIPFVEGQQTASLGFSFDQFRSWKCAVMVEWNFPGDLAQISMDGKIETADNVRLNVAPVGTTDRLLYIGDSGYSDELRPPGIFDASGVAIVNVVKGYRYAFADNGNGPLVNGASVVDSGIFKAVGNTVAVKGTPFSPVTFSLRTAENYMTVIEAMRREKDVSAWLHGGDIAPPSGTLLDVTMGLFPINFPTLYAVAGDQDWTTDNGKYFFNLLHAPRYYHVDFQHVSVFFFSGFAGEPDGITPGSVQWGRMLEWRDVTTQPFKLIICHFPPVSNSQWDTPGFPALMPLLSLAGISALICANTNNTERFGQFDVPLFNCASGGQNLVGFTGRLPSAYQNSTDHGYLKISADALSCRIGFMNTSNMELDAATLYAK